MLSRQGTQELGQEDQIDEISSRHWEAVGTECRESPNLTRFCRLAQQPYHDFGATLARHADHDAPKIRKAACLGDGQAQQVDPLRRQGFLQQGLTDIRQALLERFAGGGKIHKPVFLGNDVPRYGGSKERILDAARKVFLDRGFEGATPAISSILAPSNPRSRNTLRAASRIRSSTSPASSLGGRPERAGARAAERALVAAVLAILFILSLQIAKPASA